MNREELFQLIGEIDPVYVEEAGARVRRRPRRMLWGAAAAACAALLAATVLPVLHAPRTEPPGAHGQTALTEEGQAAGINDLFVAGVPVDAGSGETVFSGAPEPSADVPVQEEATAAYQALMAQFERAYGPGAYPDWYGGAYVVGGDFLIVNVLNSFQETLEDKAFYLQVQEWAGSTRVGFGGTEHSMNELLALQKEVEALPELEALSSWGCGVDERLGRLRLSVPGAPPALLSALAELDPAGDMILLEEDGTAAAVEEPVAKVGGLSSTLDRGG